MKRLNQIKKERQITKELLKKMKEEEAIEKEISEIMPEEKFTIKESIELLKGKDEEELEYESYLTEEELEEERRKQKENKRIAKIAGIVMVCVITLVIIGTNVFYNTFKSDLLKITEPLLKSHYESLTGEKAKTRTIEELMTKNEEKKLVGTGIYLLTTETNKHIMAINNEVLGDDINTSKRNQEIKDYILPYLGNIELITDSISLSYDEYYTSYNRFLDYINVLPSKLSTSELIASQKLALTYKIIYQGEIDIFSIENLIKTFSINSTFVLFKQDSTGIKNVTVVNQDKTLSFDITAEIEKEKGITYLELDRTVNGVVDLDVSLFASSSVSSKNDYNIVNPMSIKKEEEQRYRDEEPKPSYYLLRVASSLITEDGFVELNTSKREDTYQEIEKDEYKDVFLLSIGSYTYIFGENDIFIGQMRGEKSFLCKIGIC